MEIFNQYLSKNLSFSHEASGKKNFELIIPSDFPYFEGHFPENPILPALISIEISFWILTNNFSISKETYKGVKKSKFTNIIQPDSKIQIELTQKENCYYQVIWKSNTEKLLTLNFEV